MKFGIPQVKKTGRRFQEDRKDHDGLKKSPFREARAIRGTAAVHREQEIDWDSITEVRSPTVTILGLSFVIQSMGEYQRFLKYESQLIIFELITLN